MKNLLLIKRVSALFAFTAISVSASSTPITYNWEGSVFFGISTPGGSVSLGDRIYGTVVYDPGAVIKDQLGINDTLYTGLSWSYVIETDSGDLAGSFDNADLYLNNSSADLIQWQAGTWSGDLIDGLAPNPQSLIYSSFFNYVITNDTLPPLLPLANFIGRKGVICMSGDGLACDGNDYQVPFNISTFEAAVVPAPTTLILFSSALLGLAGIARVKILQYSKLPGTLTACPLLKAF